MVPESARLTPEERANLVAYLDHELDPAQAEAIEAKLANSATARHEVDAMARAWDLLDALPRPEAPADLTSRTLQRAAPWRRPRRSWSRPPAGPPGSWRRSPSAWRRRPAPWGSAML